jgi:plasmid stabilization system protein ParE
LLVAAALRALATSPERTGVRKIEPRGLCLFHLRHVRGQTPPGERIANPRQFIVFRETEERLVVLRALHDSMDLPRQLGADEDHN